MCVVCVCNFGGEVEESAFRAAIRRRHTGARCKRAGFYGSATHSHAKSNIGETSGFQTRPVFPAKKPPIWQKRPSPPLMHWIASGCGAASLLIQTDADCCAAPSKKAHDDEAQIISPHVLNFQELLNQSRPCRCCERCGEGTWKIGKRAAMPSRQ